MKDLFSQHASAYATYRPQYPKELFEYLLEQTSGRERAWDVGTGNGQVAFELSAFFEHVDATDISREQLQEGAAREGLTYHACSAEKTPFPDECFDLITVAQALHWFNVEAFHNEVQRVAKPGALLAEWGYGRLQADDQDLDRELERFYIKKIGPYWDSERDHIDREYKDLPFPFEGLQRARFWIEVDWDPERTAAYLRTWSSVQRYIHLNGEDPVDEMEKDLKGRLASLRFRFPVFLRWGRVR